MRLNKTQPPSMHDTWSRVAAALVPGVLCGFPPVALLVPEMLAAGENSSSHSSFRESSSPAVSVAVTVGQENDRSSASVVTVLV